MVNRRSILKVVAMGIPAAYAGLNGHIQFAIDKLGSVKNLALSTLYFMYHKDKVDINPRYLKNHNFTAWHKEIHPYLKNLPSLGIPNGKVVELGVHQGLSSTVLKQIFGADRYMGVDTHPYTEDPLVIRKDIRDLADLDSKAGLIWNDISTWEGSPRSRLAAYKWAIRNLKPGGIYIDEGCHKIPADIDYSSFQLVHKGQNFTVFRKKV